MEHTWHVWARKGVCLAASAALAATMVVIAPAAEATAAEGDLAISTRADLQRFRDAVNGGTDYAGKTVTLRGSLSLKGVDWEPIGTKEHPFKGVFDGAGYDVSGLTVAGTSDLGLFGWVGVGGRILNLSVTNGDNGDEPSSITATGSSTLIRNVGSIAGYVYGSIGTDAPAIENCKSAASVSVVSTMVPSEDKIAKFTPEGEVQADSASPAGASIAAGYNDDGKTMEYIGGVAGYCAGSIRAAQFTGTLSAVTQQAPIISSPTMGKCIGGVVGQMGGYVAEAAITGTDETMLVAEYPQADGSYANTTEGVALLADSTNAATVKTVADASAGLDRFGTESTASLTCVGGVAGFAMADVEGCLNTGTLDTPTAGATGGVVGCLRGLPYTSPNAVDADAGALVKPTVSGSKVSSYEVLSTGPELTVSRCENRADVTGLAIVGGVVGQAGTYTAIELSKNSNSKAMVTGTRWNKPQVGGVAGQCFGNISRCYNRADCRTYNMKTKELGGGYYVAGIVGLVGAYLESSGAAFTSPTADIAGCYSTGTILAGGDYRQAGIAGENSGYIHDCAFVSGSVLKDRVVSDEYGTTASSARAVNADDMKGKAFCGSMNVPTSVEQYAAGACFVPDFADEDDRLNDGYPVFASERTASAADSKRTELDNTGLAASGTGSASYTAVANPVPALSVSYQSGALVQGADYYVLPDSTALGANGICRNVYDDGTDGYIKSGERFGARIVGIGEYKTSRSGGSSFTAAYTIGQGDFSTCTPSIAAVTFNYLPQYPDKDKDVTIYDAGGNVVSGNQWSMPADPGTCVNFKHLYDNETYDKKAHDGYQIEFTANKASNYKGTTYGFFKINRANLFDDKTDFAGFTWGGRQWLWKSGNIVNGGKTQGYIYTLDASGNEVKGMNIAYCGEQIRPTPISLKYEGGDGVKRELELGNDYRVVYGDPGRDDLIADDNTTTNTNPAASDGAVGKRPCATVRYVPGYTKNFTNYQSFFFSIVKANVSDSSQCTVSIPAGITIGNAKAVTVTSYTGKKIPSSYYTVSFAAAGSGKVKVTVKGTGNLTGTYSKVVAAKKAKKGQSIESGTATYTVVNAGKRTVAYAGQTKAAQTVSIPASFKIAGVSYKVVQVAKNALKGDKTVTKLTIGKNVAKIGAGAFNGASKLANVTIKTSKLRKGSIGSKAFAGIALKPSVKVPAKKLKAYKGYLKKGGLTGKAKVRK